MDIHSIRSLLKMKAIYDIPLRVTYYARVSSESDEQLNSLGNQITYYEDLIKRNRNWTFVPGYIDEGLSGISTKKRENFNRMIEEAAEDKFDLVITKEISRFARNTLDSIQFTRQLLGHGVGVFFQNDNINTLDEDSELRLSIMSSIAQDELRKLSSRVKFGHAQAIKDGVVLGNNRIFGYQKDNGRLVIDEDEAPMVRELFELYSTGECSMKQITDNEYLHRSRECEQEIDRLQKQLAELQQEQESKEDFRKHMESIRTVMRDAQRDANQQIVSKEFIDKYIDRIFATPQEDDSLRLEIKIFTGEATEKYLNRLKQRAASQENAPVCAAVGAGRTGHTFKYMLKSGDRTARYLDSFSTSRSGCFHTRSNL